MQRAAHTHHRLRLILLALLLAAAVTGATWEGVDHWGGGAVVPHPLLWLDDRGEIEVPLTGLPTTLSIVPSTGQGGIRLRLPGSGSSLAQSLPVGTYRVSVVCPSLNACASVDGVAVASIVVSRGGTTLVSLSQSQGLGL